MLILFSPHSLEDIQFIDFADDWQAAFETLLIDMQRHPVLRVTRHDKRRIRGTEEAERHRRYLRKVAQRVGTLNLSVINEEQGGRVPLEQVYVDLPTELSLSVEVQNWHIVDGYIDPGRSLPDDDTRQRIVNVMPDAASLNRLIDDIQQDIDAYRRDNPDKSPEERWHRWNNGVHRRVLNLNTQDIAAAVPRLVVLGEPGSGKSTFVRYLALCLAGAGLENPVHPVTTANLRHWVHGALTPIYIELRRFVASSYFPKDIKTLPTDRHLWDYIQHEILGADLETYLPDLKTDVEEGQAVLLLDGLDEVPYPEGDLQARQKQLIALAERLNSTMYVRSRVIVASRPYAYEGWTLPGFDDVTIADFEDRHRIDLATRLYRVTGRSEGDATATARQLNTELEEKRVDVELKNRPLFLTLMSQVYIEDSEEGLPTRPGALYRRSIMLLLGKWTQSKPGVRPLIEILGSKSLNDLYNRLAALAYSVHTQYGDRKGTPEIPLGLIYEHLLPLGYTRAGQMIPYLSENAGVLVSPGQNEERDVVQFAHRTFQEYLAAAHIVYLCREADSYRLLHDLITTKPQMWRVPGQLVGDVIIDTGREGELWKLLSALLEKGIPRDRESPRWWAGWLASDTTYQQGLYRVDEATLNQLMEKPVRDALIKWLVVMLEYGALPPVERAACGRTLALLGDPRSGVGLREKDDLPDIDWVKIPADTFLMGSDKNIDDLAYDRETPQHEVDLPTYYISRYPLTVKQYRAFMDAGGYDNRNYWTDAGWQWKENITQPRYWQDERSNAPNQPVNGLSWYEAYAVTQWLNDVLTVRPDETMMLRLPTEQEWEKAARGTDGRIYPYGNESDAAKGNISETGIGTTSAAGIFPAGKSPYGVLDMSGNLFDWCLTKWRDSYDDPENNDPACDSHRVRRGGAFNLNQQRSRCAYRNHDHPGYQSSNFGLRVVCGVPVS